MISRMWRAAQLDVSLYEEVEHNLALTKEAVTIVVAITALNVVSGLISVAFMGVSLRFAGLSDVTISTGALVASTLFDGVWRIVAFFFWAWLTFFIGTRFFQATATYGELIRTLGYAYTPFVLGVFSFIPCLGAIVSLVGLVWALVAMVIAVRQALDLETGKTLLTIVIGAVPYVLGSLLIRGAIGSAFLFMG